MHTYTGPNALVYVKVFSKPEKLYPFSLLFDVFLRASFLSPAFFFFNGRRQVLVPLGKRMCRMWSIHHKLSIQLGMQALTRAACHVPPPSTVQAVPCGRCSVEGRVSP